MSWSVDSYARKLFRDYLAHTGRHSGSITPGERAMLMERFEDQARVYLASLRRQKPKREILARMSEAYLTPEQASEHVAQAQMERPRPDRAEYLPEYDAALQKREQQRAIQAQKLREMKRQLEWEMSREGRRVMAAREQKERQERVAHLETITKPAQYPTRRMVAGDSGIRIDPALRYRGR